MRRFAPQKKFFPLGYNTKKLPPRGCAGYFVGCNKQQGDRCRRDVASWLQSQSRVRCRRLEASLAGYGGRQKWQGLSGPFAQASKEVLATRKILKAKRSACGTSNSNTGVSIRSDSIPFASSRSSAAAAAAAPAKVCRCCWW